MYSDHYNFITEVKFFIIKEEEKNRQRKNKRKLIKTTDSISLKIQSTIAQSYVDNVQHITSDALQRQNPMPSRLKRNEMYYVQHTTTPFEFVML